DFKLRQKPVQRDAIYNIAADLRPNFGFKLVLAALHSVALVPVCAAGFTSHSSVRCAGSRTFHRVVMRLGVLAGCVCLCVGCSGVLSVVGSAALCGVRSVG